MFEIFGKSKVVVNHHGNVPQFANNMRLYEATGSRALLVTDWKPDLSDIFEDGIDVISYRRPSECIARISYYLENGRERQQIAQRGQTRTLQTHTYLHRMKQLVQLIAKISG
jgi:spore maturation protein CgeB